MARMLLDPPNFLVLDEPTNHLDLATKEMLVDVAGRLRGHDALRVARPGVPARARNRVLELGGESGTETEPHAYPGLYVEYVAAHRTRSTGRARVNGQPFARRAFAGRFSGSTPTAAISRAFARRSTERLRFFWKRALSPFFSDIARTPCHRNRKVPSSLRTGSSCSVLQVLVPFSLLRACVQNLCSEGFLVAAQILQHCEKKTREMFTFSSSSGTCSQFA